jgi:Dolichyl-phosphate-mannose-protein mannosyltransferase
LAADVIAGHFTPNLKHREHADGRTRTLHVHYSRFWLAAVGIGVLVSCVSAVVGLTGRGAFFDEGVYLLVGRLLVSQGQNWHFETWLVGSPWAFPLVAGLIERLGGNLREVRLFNSVALGISTVGVVWLTHLLRFNRDSLTALVSGLIFGLTGVCLFTGSFATYDALALTLTIWALCFTLKAAERGDLAGAVWAWGAGAAFGAAVLTKYIVIVLAPIALALLWRRWVWMTCWTLVAGCIVGAYFAAFWWQMLLVVRYSGGHTTSYGARPLDILLELAVYTGWALALGALGGLLVWRRNAAVLLGGALIIPAYHLWHDDPLALFKQVCWSVALLAPLAAVALQFLWTQRRVAFVAMVASGLALSAYTVVTLRQFYPDPTPAAAWLQAHADPSRDLILADDVWPYRAALSSAYEGREWWVVDQWWWENVLATPQTWTGLVDTGTFRYIVLEQGGAFNGPGSIITQSVAADVSARYRLVASFPSRVTWGNAVLPTHRQLSPNATVTTQIFERISP